MILVTQIARKKYENCFIKNLFYAGALAAASLLAMSCTSTATTAESSSASEVSANINPENSSNGTATSDSTQPNQAKAIIIDVRTQSEWDNDGHAPCAKLIPLDQLEQRVAELKPYSKITVVCRSGGRAGKAASFLKSAGFEDVTNAGPWQNANCE